MRLGDLLEMADKTVTPRQLRAPVCGLHLGIEQSVLIGRCRQNAASIAARHLDIPFGHQAHRDQHLLQRVIRKLGRARDHVGQHHALFKDLPLDQGAGKGVLVGKVVEEPGAADPDRHRDFLDRGGIEPLRHDGIMRKRKNPVAGARSAAWGVK